MEDLTHREREIVERVIADTGDVVDMGERLRAFSDAWLRAMANGCEQPDALVRRWQVYRISNRALGVLVGRDKQAGPRFVAAVRGVFHEQEAATWAALLLDGD